ncbi:MAG: LysR family transcriptional regulator [Hyphomicrobiaceae bacterium]|nr:LysR family transcriptional regulator [Hyphomicrobiaceae bacterium]
MQINPRQVEAFRLVMLRGSVTLAAQELAISQPAVSRLVREFELRIGLSLFERRGNHLVPTPEATLLLAEIERSFTGLRTIAKFAQDLSQRRTGSLRVVALPAMAMGFIPRFVGQFIAERRLRQVYLQGMPSHLVIEAVASGHAEVGFVAAPFERPGLRTEQLAARAVIVMPAGHRLAARRCITPRELAGERFIALTEASIFSARIDAVLADVPRDVIVETPLTGIACSLALAGTGLALVDPFSASDFEDRGLVIRPFRPVIDTRVASITSAHRRLSRIATEFIEAIRAHTAALDRRIGGAREAGSETRR